MNKHYLKEICLAILTEHLEKAGVRKYTCCNGVGYSQVERDIIDDMIKSMEDQNIISSLENSFYMDICKAYNAGKSNTVKVLRLEDDFISSHDYFVNEFPDFKTNVP